MSARKTLIIWKSKTFPGCKSVSDNRSASPSTHQLFLNTIKPKTASSNNAPQRKLCLTPIRSLTESKRQKHQNSSLEPSYSVRKRMDVKKCLTYKSIQNNDREIQDQKKVTLTEHRASTEVPCEKVHSKAYSAINIVTNFYSQCLNSRKLIMLTTLIALLVLAVLVIMNLFITTSSVFRHRHVNSLNVTELTISLSQNVFGQHIAVRMIPNAIKGFLKVNKTVLVLSFHGSTGVGKSYVSNLMTALQGVISVKFYTQIHFTHENEDALYSKQIESWILSYSTRCGIMMFVIDDIDTATPGVFKGLHSALDKLERQQSMLEIDWHKFIILTLSSSGGHVINKHTLKHRMTGHRRDTVQTQLLVKKIITTIPGLEKKFYNRLRQSAISHLVIPFLPLEKEHVYQCIGHDFTQKHKTENEQMVKVIAEELFYYPYGVNLFAKVGCKSVSAKVDLLT